MCRTDGKGSVSAGFVSDTVNRHPAVKLNAVSAAFLNVCLKNVEAVQRRVLRESVFFRVDRENECAVVKKFKTNDIESHVINFLDTLCDLFTRFT